MSQRRPNLNRAVRALLDDVSTRMKEFGHIRSARILVVAGEARRASRGTVKPLTFGGETPPDRKKPVVKVKGRRMLYCITLRPLFFRDSTPQQRIGTVLHELFHISPAFDGTLHPERRHAAVGREFAKKLGPLVRRYLKQCPPEVWAPFAYDGEVRVSQWLERPSAFYVPGRAKVRRVYTEEQLFEGPVRMITRRARASKGPRARIKLH